MLVTVREKGIKKGVEIDGKFYAFQGKNQNRCYINLDGKTISLNPKIEDFAFGDVIELDDYKRTRNATRTTTQHGTRKSKSRLNVCDYLSEQQVNEYNTLKNNITKYNELISQANIALNNLVNIASNNFENEQAKLKEQKEAEKQARQQQVYNNKYNKLLQLAKELNIDIKNI